MLRSNYKLFSKNELNVFSNRVCGECYRYLVMICFIGLNFGIKVF